MNTTEYIDSEYKKFLDNWQDMVGPGSKATFTQGYFSGVMRSVIRPDVIEKILVTPIESDWVEVELEDGFGPVRKRDMGRVAERIFKLMIKNSME